MTTNHHNNVALIAYLRIVKLIAFLRTDKLHQEMEELRDSLLAFIVDNTDVDNTAEENAVVENSVVNNSTISGVVLEKLIVGS